MSSTSNDLGRALFYIAIGFGVGWLVFTPKGQELGKSCIKAGYKKVKCAWDERVVGKMCVARDGTRWPME